MSLNSLCHEFDCTAQIYSSFIEVRLVFAPVCVVCHIRRPTRNLFSNALGSNWMWLSSDEIVLTDPQICFPSKDQQVQRLRFMPILALLWFPITRSVDQENYLDWFTILSCAKLRTFPIRLFTPSVFFQTWINRKRTAVWSPIRESSEKRWQ